MYELMMETFIRKAKIKDLNGWFADYSIRRYGLNSIELKEAWQILGRSIYNCCDAMKPRPKKPFRFHGRTAFTSFPRIGENGNIVGSGYPKWFSVHDVLNAWTLMLFGTIKSEKVVKDL